MVFTNFNLASLNSTNGFIINGVAGDDQFGSDVSSAGDVNGDGIDDVIIGAPEADPNGNTSAGIAYVVFGKARFANPFLPSALNGNNGFRINGIAAEDRAGFSVSSAGDVNGDGIDDLIVGAPDADTNGLSAGQAYVIFGKRNFAANFNLSTLNGSNGFRLNGIAAGDNAGFSVGSAGDINRDGIGDVVVGAPGADPNGNASAGQVYVVFGRRSGLTASLNLSSLNGTNGFRLNGTAIDDRTGVAVSGSGDINGDRVSDLIIGSADADFNGFNSGKSYVLFGRGGGFAASFNLSGLDGSNGFAIVGSAADDRFGTSVSAAGDINGDGLNDLIAGAIGVDPSGKFSAGRSYVIFGSRNGFAATFNLSSLTGSNGFSLSGGVTDDQAGFSVSGLGDVNFDGVDDLLVGAPGADPGGRTSAGQSYVVFGSRTFASTVNLAALNGSNGFMLNGISAGSHSGAAVSRAGDVNNDGIPDLLIGAPGAAANGNVSSGQAYVVFGFFGSIPGYVSTPPTVNAGKVTFGSIRASLAQGRIVFNFKPRPVSRELAGDYVNIFGTNFADTLTGDRQDNTLVGNGGSDQLSGLAGADSLRGGTGNDILDGSSGTDTVVEVANDNLRLTNTYLTGMGRDRLINIESARLFGNSANNTLNASNYSRGKTQLLGRGGDDVLVGGRRDDTLLGGDGRDRLTGGLGDDEFRGGKDLDWLVETGNVNFTLSNKRLEGLGIDRLLGMNAASLSAGNRNNKMDASAFTLGRVILDGSSGSDTLIGGRKGDVLIGDSGGDRLTGGFGRDVLNGGRGRDRFIFDTDKPFRRATMGVDLIQDFRRLQDWIVLDRTTFTALGNELSFAVVTSRAAAQKSEAIITYVRSTGALFYNSNRTAIGFGRGGQFATIADQPLLSVQNFLIQA
jgi:Ca2+-binding RTX toxin-like protein